MNTVKIIKKEIRYGKRWKKIEFIMKIPFAMRFIKKVKKRKIRDCQKDERERAILRIYSRDHGFIHGRN